MTLNARSSRLVRPPTWDLLKAQVTREADRLIDSKIQNNEVLSVFHKITKHRTSAQEKRQLALDALKAGDMARVELYLLEMGADLDSISNLEQEGIALERTDVRRDEERGDELRIRNQQVTDWTRREKDGRPGDDGR